MSRRRLGPNDVLGRYAALSDTVVAGLQLPRSSRSLSPPSPWLSGLSVSEVRPGPGELPTLLFFTPR